MTARTVVPLLILAFLLAALFAEHFRLELLMSLVSDRINALVALIRQLIARDQNSQATIAGLQAENAALRAENAQLKARVADDAATPEDYAALDDASAQLVTQINADPAVPTQVIARVLAARDRIDGMESPDKPIRDPQP